MGSATPAIGGVKLQNYTRRNGPENLTMRGEACPRGGVVQIGGIHVATGVTNTDVTGKAGVYQNVRKPVGGTNSFRLKTGRFRFCTIKKDEYANDEVPEDATMEAFAGEEECLGYVLVQSGSAQTLEPDTPLVPQNGSFSLGIGDASAVAGLKCVALTAGSQAVINSTTNLVLVRFQGENGYGAL